MPRGSAGIECKGFMTMVTDGALGERIDQFRNVAGRGSLERLAQAVSSSFFCESDAAAALAAHRSAWLHEFGSMEGIFSAPWGDGHDSGQCGNAFVSERSGSPLIAACRWGSAEAIDWICGQDDIHLFVEFQHTSQIFAVGLAASNGCVQALAPLWRAMERAGWSSDQKAQGLSSWLAGVASSVNGSLGDVLEKIEAARQPLETLSHKSGLLILPISTSEIFTTAIEAAIHHHNGQPRILEALLGLGLSLWAHPRALGAGFDYDASNPPETFVEEALCAGGHEAVALLAGKGFELPSPERAQYLVDSFSSAKTCEGAMAALAELWAIAESREIELSIASFGRTSVPKARSL